MRNPLDKEHLQALPIAWWSAIAGAAVAGATLFPNARMLAGLIAGGGMLALALQLTPCCAGCAAGKGCGGGTTAGAAAAELELGQRNTAAIADGDPLPTAPTDVRELVAKGTDILGAFENRGNPGNCGLPS